MQGTFWKKCCALIKKQAKTWIQTCQFNTKNTLNTLFCVSLRTKNENILYTIQLMSIAIFTIIKINIDFKIFFFTVSSSIILQSVEESGVVSKFIVTLGCFLYDSIVVKFLLHWTLSISTIQWNLSISIINLELISQSLYGHSRLFSFLYLEFSLCRFFFLVTCKV